MNVPAPNWRFEAVVAELAEVIHEEHVWECGYSLSCDGVTCAADRARAVLAYLHGAGLIWWGANTNPIPPLPDGALEPYALRLMGEFWHPVGEQTPEEAELGIRNYHWLPGVLAVHGGYPGRGETAVRTFLDDLTKEQIGHLAPVLQAVLGKLGPPATTREQRLSLFELRELCDEVRARLMYDRSRGFSTMDRHVWERLGWDVGHRDGAGLLHPSLAVSKIFHVPAWCPNLDELTWFRDGFARQREGSPRPTIRG